MQITTADRLAIHELIALYGHIIDDRAFSRLNEIFTEDAVFDLTGYGDEKHFGLKAIQTLMALSKEHPLAHHASNIVIQIKGETIQVISKGLGVGNKGRVGSVVYRDRLIRDNDRSGNDNWRIAERKVELRSTENIPAIN